MYMIHACIQHMHMHVWPVADREALVVVCLFVGGGGERMGKSCGRLNTVMVCHHYS